MERDSIIYKTRRKIQVLAHHFFSNEILSKFYYKMVLKEKLDLDNPQTFNEKIQWLKLYEWPNNDVVINCTDKYKVREYISAHGYGNILTPLLGAWDKAEEIDWNKLPNQFVLKCNHGCAYNIVVKDKNVVDKNQIIKQLNKWLKEDFGAYNIEVHYSKIKPRKIICEQYLGENLVDYKFFCFNGEPKYVYISNDLLHDRQAKIGFYNLDGTKMELIRDDYIDYDDVKFPGFFNELVKISKNLSKDFPFVRVDFFIVDGKFYFAELTFTPSAGMMPFNPKKYDLKWGNHIDLTKYIKGDKSEK